MQTIKGAQYRNQQIVLDGTTFEGCVFENCTLTYNGGEMFNLHDCELSDNQWRLGETPSRTIAFLRSLYAIPELRPLAESVIENIKGGTGAGAEVPRKKVGQLKMSPENQNRVPAFCPEHGLFLTPFQIPPNAKNFVMQDNRINCPFCGRDCEMLPGTYDTSKEWLQVLLDPSVSPEAVAALKTLAQKLQRKEITLEQAKAEANRISPAFTKLFNIGEWGDAARATFIASIIAAAAQIGAAKLNSSSTTQTVNVQPVIERIIERAPQMPKREGLEAPLPRPRPKPSKPPKPPKC